MKKFLALLLALTMALALVACGGGDDAASDTTADSGDDALPLPLASSRK